MATCPQAVAAEIGRILDVPLADIYGVIDFYSMFYRDAVGKTVIQVCDDPACGLAGSDELLDKRLPPPWRSAARDQRRWSLYS